MAKIYWIIAAVVAVLLLGGVYAYFKINTVPSGPAGQTDSNQNALPNNSGSQTVTVPSAGQSGDAATSGFMVAAMNGGEIPVNDFTKDPETASTPNIPDSYFLAGGVHPGDTDATYSIMYVKSDKSFTISLWSEPLAGVRRQAEAALIAKLGITETSACALKYAVLVPYRVNEYYAGKNLGFSFCPGAEAL